MRSANLPYTQEPQYEEPAALFPEATRTTDHLRILAIVGLPAPIQPPQTPGSTDNDDILFYARMRYAMD